MSSEVTDNEELIFNRLLQCEEVTLYVWNQLNINQKDNPVVLSVAEPVFVPGM